MSQDEEPERLAVEGGEQSTGAPATAKDRPRGSKKMPWTGLEDSRLKSIIENCTEGVDKDGKIILSLTWGEIADMIPNRTAKQCRERWCYNLDPTIRHDDWAIEEDAVLMKAQGRFQNQWALIAKYLPGRTENAVKTRFKSIMRAKKREWSPAEDKQIFDLIRVHGSKWDVIKEKFPGRTANAVKTRFSLLKKGAHRPNVSDIAGAARQIWLRPALIDNIPLEHFLALNKRTTQIPQHQVPVLPIIPQQPQMAFQMPMSANRGPIMVPVQMSGPMNSGCKVLGKRVGQCLPNGHKSIRLSPGFRNHEQKTSENPDVDVVSSGIQIIKGALLGDRILNDQDKVKLVSQSENLLQNYFELKKHRLKSQLL